MANDTDSRIYTRTGDAGETGLFDGTRVSKADPRVDACGEVDELGSWLGVVCTVTTDDVLVTRLRQVQRDLFALAARLADPEGRIASRVDKARLGTADVARLEGWIDEVEASLPRLRRFVLTGGSPPGAYLQLARAVCRRAERRVVGLGERDEVAVTYLNRLSDLLFVTARAADARQGVPEVEW